MLSDMNAKVGKECLVMSEVPALMAVHVVLILGLTYSKLLPISGYWQFVGQGFNFRYLIILTP